MLKYIKQEKGYSLILVVLLVALISILGISLLTLTSNSLKISTSERDDQSVFYIAEGGLNKTKKNFEQLVLTTYDETRLIFNKLPAKERTPEKFKAHFVNAFDSSLNTLPSSVTYEEQFKQNPIAEITVDQVNLEPLQYKINSVGTLGNKNRIVAQTITIDLGNGTSTGSTFTNTSAIHAIKNIELGGGTFNGDVVSDSGKISITQGGTNIKGKIGVTPENFSKPSWMNISNEFIGNIAFPENILPSFPESLFSNLSSKPHTKSIQVTIDGKKTQLNLDNNSIKIDGGGNGNINGVAKFSGVLPLTQDMYLKNFTVASNRVLTIDVGDSDKNLYIDNFAFNEQGNFNIIGSGKLNIYIKDSFKFMGSSTMNNSGSFENLNLYYNGSSNMEFAGDSRTKASIYVKTASIKIDGSGSIQGSIYSGGPSISIGGGSFNHNTYIYAPNAEVKLSGSGTVIGGIMAYNVKSSGNPTVTYQKNSSSDITSGEEIKYEENDNLTISNSMLEVE
ncbi:PilX N-terminal domain-containing pilus assembly protein [Lysinibacillus sp. NPDC097162]|uniref:DUF7305 domain-containing protein n=1 Tax=Lysinibacillus sp. NPDC097162 TaxID=3364140 RepID=UPI0038099184